MQKLSILFFMVLFIPSGVAQEIADSETLLQYLHRDQQKLAYKVDVHKKSFFQDDTLEISYDVFVEKNKKDSIYGYNFKIIGPHEVVYNVNNTLYSFFDYNEERKFNKTQKKNGKLGLLIMPNMNLEAGDFDDTLHSSVSEVNEGHIIHKHYDSINEIKNIDLTYTFSTDFHQLISFTSSVYFQDSQQYRQLDFGKLKYNFDLDFAGELDQLLKVSSPYEIPQQKTVADIEKFPNLNGSLLNQDQATELKTFNSEILILDYWYMACYPCIKSIPILNKIKNKYSESQVQVVGVNIIDNEIDKNTSLNKFVDKHKINYHLFFTKENPLSINSFPTVLFLDKDFNIIYTNSGYGETMEEEIMEAIEKHLLK